MNQETIHIFESELQLIAAEAQKYPTAETGGDLYGLFTHGGAPVIWLASGPGPRCQRNGTQFEQDTEFMSRWQATLFEKSGVQYIGSWHSHHQLGLNQPSSGDVRAAQVYAAQHRRSQTLELLVNLESHDRGLTPVLRPYFYRAATTGQHSLVGIRVLEGASPLRPVLGHLAQEFQAGLTRGSQHYLLHDQLTHARTGEPRLAIARGADYLQSSLELLLSEADLDVEVKGIRGEMALLEVANRGMKILISVDFAGGPKVTSAGYVDSSRDAVIPVEQVCGKSSPTFPMMSASGKDFRKLAEDLAQQGGKRGSRGFFGGRR